MVVLGEHSEEACDSLLGGLPVVTATSFEELMDLAAEKDHGFDKTFFMDNLSRFRRFTPEDLGVTDDEYQRLHMTIENWRRRLQRSLDPPEQGLGPDR